jgi:hypothetical protein
MRSAKRGKGADGGLMARFGAAFYGRTNGIDENGHVKRLAQTRESLGTAVIERLIGPAYEYDRHMWMDIVNF